MRGVFFTLLSTLTIGLIGAAGFVWFGVYDVSATHPHWPVSYWLMETVRERSVQARAAGITPPQGMTSEANVNVGTEHFAAHCAVCHGAPGVPRGEIADGLYPRPADLRNSVKRYTPGELFWIVKNGIKMSGMPSWSDHSDDELWATVAFLEKLPTMNEEDYRRLVMASIRSGGGMHHHGGTGGESVDHSSIPGMTSAPGDDHR